MAFCHEDLRIRMPDADGARPNKGRINAITFCVPTSSPPACRLPSLPLTSTGPIFGTLHVTCRLPAVLRFLC